VVYWLARPRSPARDAGLARIVAVLEDTREGATWRTPPELLAPEQRERHPGGVLDCGLAHGAPGPIAMLARIDERVVDPPLAARARELAAEATRWLLAQRLATEGASAFPAISGGGPARTAWCYGDPGAAMALAWTARGEAEAIARDAAYRDPEDRGVTDAAFCHGALGLAHLWNRWFQATGAEPFRGALRDWIVRGLVMPRPSAPGLLEGAAGIGLVLLAAIGSDEPAWDRMLACDIPAR
ncbi:MAG: lanthionine synthetase LanC family protein, partial [Acidobacteriota bacterium]